MLQDAIERDKQYAGAKYRDNGAIAQLGERLICIQEVRGSIPRSSTTVCGEGGSKPPAFDPPAFESGIKQTQMQMPPAASASGFVSQVFFNKVD